MIKLRCHNCNQKIGVKESNIAKKLRCPKCKAILTLPKASNSHSPENLSSTHPGESDGTGLDPQMFDVPRISETSSLKTETPSISPEPALAPDEPPPMTVMNTFEPQSEPLPTRKFPWLIDIFLYPISTPGLTALAIIVLIPVFIALTAKALGRLSFIIAIGTFPIRILIGLYIFWYLCQCIRESALGGIRAPDILVEAPGLGEMYSQFLNIAACWACFIAPAFIYKVYTNDTGPIFWGLIAYAVIFFPMALLAVLMFGSFTGLNPLLLIPSIFSTFFQYLALIGFVGALVTAYAAVAQAVKGKVILEFIAAVSLVYLLMIIAHLIGRFFWKYKEKLNWEV
jgi:hypothetical protein